MSLIELHHVGKRFRIPTDSRRTVREHLLALHRRRTFETLEVLDDVSFSLGPGESLGVMGRNGSGKSTLLKIICNVYPPDSGRVVVRAAITPLLELGLGWNGELDAVDNILVMSTVMGMSLGEARRSIDEVLAFAELERFASLPLKHYSSGMASRLAYAVAFRAVQEVLVIDETFAVGDVGFRRRCEQRYRELIAAGHSGILVAHDCRAIEEFCDRAFLLEGGRLVREGTGKAIAESYVQLSASRAPAMASAASV